MTNLTVPNAFVSGSSIVASEMNANFDAVKTLVNSTGVPKLQDGVVTSAAFASGAVDYAALHASQRYEPGDLKWSARSSAQTGWLLCDGSAVSRSTYASLYAAIGTTYGAGNGTTTFNIPDGRGRTLIAPDATAGRVASSNALGDSGGASTHLLTGAESGTSAHDHGNTFALTNATVASSTHTHTQQGTFESGYKYSGTTFTNTSVVTDGYERVNATHTHRTTISGATTAASATTTVGVTGAVSTSSAANASSAHNNMQPYVVGNLFIKT